MPTSRVSSSLAKLSLDRLYALFSAPMVLALTFILPPFQAPDEAAHFYRAVQISHAAILPMRVPDTYRPAAGGLVDRSAFLLVDRYCGMPNWSCARTARPAITALVPTGSATAAADPLRATAFSNTVVYLPVVHLFPAMAIVAARAAGLAPIGWLYAGRLANAVFSLVTIGLALRLLRDRRQSRLIFAMASLPMVISVLPTLSADGPVVSCALMLFALCVRLLEGDERPGWFWVALAFTVSIAAVAKFAYLPLAFIPLACTLASRQPSGTVLKAASIGLAAVVLTAAWSRAVDGMVFPISIDRTVDPMQQVAFAERHLGQVIAIVVRSVIHSRSDLITMALGRRLSALTVQVPWIILIVAGLTLLAAMSGSAPPRGSLRGRYLLPVLILPILVLAAFLTFLFLYLQNSPVGGGSVAGYQGRYLLPLLPFAAFLLPPGHGTADTPQGRGIVAAGSIVTTVALIAFLGFRSWT